MINSSSFNLKSLNERVSLKNFVANYKSNHAWHKGLDLDHIIPIKLAGNIKLLKTFLNNINNLRLVHKNCHKDKTFGKEEQELLKNYRRTHKSLIPKDTKLKILNQDKLQKLRIQTLLELEKNKKFRYIHKFKNKTIGKLFNKFLSEVKLH